MKNILTILTLFAFTFCLNAQALIYVDDYTILPDESIDVPIKVIGFDNIFGIQLFPSWDPAIVEYQELGNLSTELPGLDASDFGVTDAMSGLLRLLWDTDNCIAIPDSTALFTINFKGIESIGDVSPINITNVEVIGCNALGIPIIFPVNVDDGSITLPVTLKSFTVEPTNSANFLHWEVAQEDNFAGYELQKSLNGIDFTRLHWQEALAPSLGDYSYDFEDRQVNCSGTTYYRLKMVEESGEFTFSDVIVAKSTNTWDGGEHFSVNNPFSDYLNIKSCDDLGTDLFLYNLAGETIMAKTIQNANTLRLNTSHLPTGIYLLRVNNHTQKIIKK